MSTKSTVLSLILLLLVPVIIILNTLLVKSENQYFVSVLIVIIALCVFFTMMEKRRLRARELVTVSVLCAIAIVSRAAFYVIPQFKPIGAVVIIAGACLGAKTGFTVGALSAFVSNFFFGQGPWTPWQMYSFGLLGFLAGVLFYNSIIPKKKLFVCIFGFLATVFVYGIIMDTASLLMMMGYMEGESLLSVYVAGLVPNLIHAGATVAFLFVGFNLMNEKIERLKQKYDLMA